MGLKNKVRFEKILGPKKFEFKIFSGSNRFSGLKLWALIKFWVWKKFFPRTFWSTKNMNAPIHRKSKMAARGTQYGRQGLECGLSARLLLYKFFDARSHSMRNGCDGEELNGRKWKKNGNNSGP